MSRPSKMTGLLDLPDEILSQIALSIKASDQQDCFDNKVDHASFNPGADLTDAPFYTLDHNFGVPSVSSVFPHSVHTDDTIYTL